MLNEMQKNALRYYVGVPDAYPDAPFDPKIYNTVNCLFFPGISSELARIKEGKTLCPALFSSPAALAAFLSDLNAAARHGISSPRTVTRVERLADYLVMKRFGQTVSFTSTSCGDFLSAYTDKEDLVLMRFALPASLPCAEMAALLDGYEKPEEEEILLPPGIPLSFAERAPDPAGRVITDRNGKPPVLAVTVTASLPPSRPIRQIPPPPAFLCSAAYRAVGALIEGQEPGETDAREYLALKERIVHAIRNG